MDVIGPDEEPRNCGECSLCCTLLRVDPLRKLGGVACLRQEVGSDAGCGIHGSPERPAVCGAYRCSWLLGRFSREDRPYRLGAVLDLSSDDGLPSLRVRGDRLETWIGGEHRRTARMPAIERGLRRVTLARPRWRLRDYRGAGSSGS